MMDVEKVVRKKKYEPEDKDYELRGIDIDDAENGVVVACRYEIKQSVKEKMRKSDQYPDSYCAPEKHVFESKDDAKKFIMSELDEMWSGE